MIITKEDALEAASLLDIEVIEAHGHWVAYGRKDDAGVTALFNAFLWPIIIAEAKYEDFLDELYRSGDWPFGTHDKIAEVLATAYGIPATYDDEGEFIIVVSDEAEAIDFIAKVNRVLVPMQYWRSIIHGEDLDSRFDCQWVHVDEFSPCESCGVAIDTKPHSYNWQPEFLLDEESGAYYCGECIGKHDDLKKMYITAHVNTGYILNNYVINMNEQPQWTGTSIYFETGMHPEQSANPERVVEVLSEIGMDVIFTGSVGQFDAERRLWVRIDWHNESLLAFKQRRNIELLERSHGGDTDKAISAIVEVYLRDIDTNYPFDIAEEYDKAQSGEGSEYVKVTQHSTNPDIRTYELLKKASKLDPESRYTDEK